MHLRSIIRKLLIIDELQLRKKKKRCDGSIFWKNPGKDNRHFQSDQITSRSERWWQQRNLLISLLIQRSPMYKAALETDESSNSERRRTLSRVRIEHMVICCPTRRRIHCRTVLKSGNGAHLETKIFPWWQHLQRLLPFARKLPSQHYRRRSERFRFCFSNTSRIWKTLRPILRRRRRYIPGQNLESSIRTPFQKRIL